MKPTSYQKIFRPFRSGVAAAVLLAEVTVVVLATLLPMALEAGEDNNPPLENPAGLDWSESSGWRFRRIALNGQPLSAEKGQARSETDEDSEESYVDSLNLNFRHDSSDIYVPLVGGSIALSVKRSATSDIWDSSEKSVKPSDLKVERPFGLGWRSGLTANLRFETHNLPPDCPNVAPADFVYVTDENGTSYRFAKIYFREDNEADGDSFDDLQKKSKVSFLPMPSNRTDQDVFLMSLKAVYADGGAPDQDGKYTIEGYEFIRKFGTKLTFDADTVFTKNLQQDDLGLHWKQVAYHRLKRVVDRLGNSLEYVPGAKLIPSSIKAQSGSGAIRQLTIVSANGVITSVEDPRGNLWHYHYEQRTLGGDTFQVLVKVTTPLPSDIVYTYELESAVNNTAGTGGMDNFYHLNLNSITSSTASGSATTTIEYAWDHTVKAFLAQFSTYYDPYATRPRIVSVTKMATGQTEEVSATFLPLPEPLDPIYLEKGAVPASGEEAEYQVKGTRACRVINAEGHTYKFTYTDPDLIDSKEIEDFIFGAGSAARNPTYLILWKNCEITHPTGVSEFVEFDVNAGLSDSKVTDYSGNVTTYEYGDSFSIVELIPELVNVFPNNHHPLFSPHYRDPTVETRAVGTPDEVTKSFEYFSTTLVPAARIMTKITDEEGRTTTYDVNSVTGLRKEEKIEEDGITIRETLYVYDDDIPGFMISSTVKNAIPTGGDLVTTMAPDTYGNVEFRTVDKAGENLETFNTYDANGNKTSSRDPKLKTTAFTYDVLNRLTLVDFPIADESQSMVYSPNGFKTSDTDENGNITLYTRDKLNRVTATTRVMGTGSPNLVTHVTYNNVNSVTKVIDPLGTETHTLYDSIQRPTQITADATGLVYVTTLAYGANSGGTAFDVSGFKPTSSIDPRGYNTIVTFDHLYRPVTTSREYTPSVFSTSHITYDDVGNAISTTDPLGKVTTTTYDALNRSLITIAAFGTPAAITVTKAYSSALLYSVTDPLLRITENGYDTAGRLTSVKAAKGTVDEATSLTEYDKNSNVTATINPLLKRWEYTYDARNRKLTDVQPAVTGGSPTVTTEYDKVGNVRKVTDPRLTVSETQYDSAYRVIKSISALGTAVEATTTPTLDANGNVLTLLDANGNTTRNTYDGLNRLLTTSTNPGTGISSSDPASPLPGDITVTNIYDPASNLLTVTDALSQQTSFEYDGLNRKTKTIWDPGTAVERTELSTYDALLQAGRTDPKGQVVAFIYDDLHRLTTANYAGRPQDSRSMTYDDVGNMLTVSYASESMANQVIRGCTQVYDNLNRVTSETSNGVTHGTTYDKAGNTITQTYGQTNRVLTCTYDDINRLGTMSEAIGAATPRVTTYAYDLNSNITRKTLPNGTYTDKVFDPRNRNTSITNLRPDATVIQSTVNTYDTIGSVIQVVESSASTAVSAGTMTTTNVYDKTYRLLTETRTDTGTSPTEVKVTGYTYDAANNRAAKSIVTNGGVAQITTYNFAGIASGFNSNQLSGYNRPDTGATVSFTYDANGNRATRVVTAAGAVTTDTYSYDYDNRLISLDFNTGTDPTKLGLYAYIYDHRTRRVNRNENAASGASVFLSFSGGTSVQEWDGARVPMTHPLGDAENDGLVNLLEYAFGTDPLNGAYNASLNVNASSYAEWAQLAITDRATPAQLASYEASQGQIQVEYVRGSDYGGGVGGVLYTLRSGTPSYNYYNSRGDVLAKTDNTGATTWQANYEAFGTRTAENGTNNDRQKANTKDEDPHGLLNEGMRYRDLEAGIFITRDPAGFVDGPNVYTYVRQNPWSAFDPYGLWETESYWGDVGQIYKNAGSGVVSGLGRALNELGHGVVKAGVFVEIAGREAANGVASLGGGSVNTEAAYDRLNAVNNHGEAFSEDITNSNSELHGADKNSAVFKGGQLTGEILAPEPGAKVKAAATAGTGLLLLSKMDDVADTGVKTARKIAESNGKKNVTKVFSSRKRMKEARPKAKPARPGKKQVTRQTKNKAGEGNKMKTDGKQTPHFHDSNHNIKTKPNVHYRRTKEYKAKSSASTQS